MRYFFYLLTFIFISLVIYYYVSDSKEVEPFELFLRKQYKQAYLQIESKETNLAKKKLLQGYLKRAEGDLSQSQQLFSQAASYSDEKDLFDEIAVNLAFNDYLVNAPSFQKRIEMIQEPKWRRFFSFLLAVKNSQPLEEEDFFVKHLTPPYYSDWMKSSFQSYFTSMKFAELESRLFVNRGEFVIARQVLEKFRGNQEADALIGETYLLEAKKLPIEARKTHYLLAMKYLKSLPSLEEEAIGLIDKGIFDQLPFYLNNLDDNSAIQKALHQKLESLVREEEYLSALKLVPWIHLPIDTSILENLSMNEQAIQLYDALGGDREKIFEIWIDLVRQASLENDQELNRLINLMSSFTVSQEKKDEAAQIFLSLGEGFWPIFPVKAERLFDTAYSLSPSLKIKQKADGIFDRLSKEAIEQKSFVSLAKLYPQAKKWGADLKQFGTVEDHLIQANKALEKKAPVEARGYALLAHSIEPDNVQIKEFVGWVSYLLGDYGEAEKWLEEAKSKDKPLIEAYLAAQVINGKDVEPFHASQSTRNKIAFALLEKDEPEKSLIWFGDDPESQAGKVFAYYLLGKDVTAFCHQLEPSYLAVLNKICGTPSLKPMEGSFSPWFLSFKKNRLDPMTQTLIQAQNEEDPKRALELLLDERSLDAMIEKAKIWIDLGEIEKAEKLLLEIQETKKRPLATKAALFDLYTKQNKWMKSYEVMSNMPAVKAKVYHKLRRFDLALEELEKVKNQGGLPDHLKSDYVNLLALNGKNTQVDMLSRAWKIPLSKNLNEIELKDPDKQEILKEIEKGDPNLIWKAIDRAKKWQQKTLPQPELEYLIGRGFDALSQKQSAISAYNLAIKLDKTYFPAYFYLAKLLDRSGLEKQTIDILYQGLFYAPDQTQGWIFLAHLQEQKGNFFEALQALETAKKVSPTSQPASIALARLQMELNNPESAVRYLEEVLQQNPNHQLALKMLIKALKNPNLISNVKDTAKYEVKLKSAQERLNKKS